MTAVLSLSWQAGLTATACFLAGYLCRIVDQEVRRREWARTRRHHPTWAHKPAERNPERPSTVRVLESTEIRNAAFDWATDDRREVSR